ncbi:DUF952 domain-containing protein [Isosphaeraceae bacterium EP7]
MTEVFHITTRDAWEHALEAGEYRSDTLATEGFIHASTREQVLSTANRFFAGRDDLLVLRIDVSKLASPLRLELGADVQELFPHLHGPLNLDAVTGARPLEPDARGHFTGPID